MSNKVNGLHPFQEVVDANNRVSRLTLYRELHRFTGMPTLEYDEIIETVTDQIWVVESKMTRTCEGCGGEIFMYEINDECFGIYIPENGNCANELPECEVVA